MKRQKGQSAVEFALMAPIVFTLILGMVYGGVMFMDYLNFNNQARTIAREISLATPSDRTALMDKYNKYTDEFAVVYKVSLNISYDNDNEPKDVIVNFNFTRPKPFLMMPERFDIVYTMRLEDNNEDT